VVAKGSNVSLNCNAKHVQSWRHYKSKFSTTLIEKRLYIDLNKKMGNIRTSNDRTSIHIQLAKELNGGVYICVGYNSIRDGYFYAASHIEISKFLIKLINIGKICLCVI